MLSILVILLYSVAIGNPILNALLVLRVLRLVKIAGNIKRFRLIIVTLMQICPHIVICAGVIFVFYYFFAIIGMEIFGGLIQGPDPKNASSVEFCGNPLLNGTDFFNNRYCNNNFNNLINAMVVLFELTVVNQWHVLTSGFVAVTNVYARFYFMAFHLMSVIIVLSSFTTFVLEAFVLEYFFSKDKMETAIETKIHQLGLGLDKNNPEAWNMFYAKEEILDDNMESLSIISEEPDGELEIPDLSQETDIRFHLSQNIKDVEVLFHRMFEKELEEESIERKEENKGPIHNILR